MTATSPLHVQPEYANAILGDHARIAVAGDWHGSAAAATQVLYRAANEGVTAVFQLGDFGLWPGYSGKGYLNAINDATKTTGIKVYWLDGNHEDFDRLEQRRRPNEPLTAFGDQLFHLARGTRWSIGGVNFCAVGGATSLDRQSRTIHQSWWPQEELTGPQVYDIAAAGSTDVLLTHDVSHEIDVPGIIHRQYTRQWPHEELERAWLHRERLGELTAALAPTHLFHGHFHTPYTKRQRTSFGEVQATGLADNFYVDANFRVLEVAELAEQIAAIRMDNNG